MKIQTDYYTKFTLGKVIIITVSMYTKYQQVLNQELCTHILGQN